MRNGGWLHDDNIERCIFVLLAIVSGIQSMANAGESASYIGKKMHVDLDGIARGMVYDFSVMEKEDHAHSSRSKVIQPRDLAGVIIKTKHGQVFLLAESHKDTDGHVDWRLVYDAIDIPKGLQLSGKPSEDSCIAENYPYDTVLLIWPDEV